ncbi:MAG: UDP-N-acetylmuramate dehydrogenase [Alphaproteobacteria bacterium]|nr:UDP-N-acetylmuramate dehydrogenase [Alphaproteobacteria bacterium]
MSAAVSGKVSYQGTFSENVPLGAQSWFRCGGSADLVFEPADVDDLAVFLKEYPADKPLIFLGGMANTIIRDKGVRGCVVRLGKAFADIHVDGTKIMAGAGALNGSVAAAAAKAGIGGLEFLSGIPGTVGGALRMNAGAYGREVKDVLVGAAGVSRETNFMPLYPHDMQFSYRHCGVSEDTIFVSAVFQGQTEDKDVVRERLKEIKSKRQSTQPISEKTGGSTFANPSVEDLENAGLPEGTKAWQLVEKVGGRDLQIGGARMSEKHLNFMINSGDATASDLEDLGDELIRRVREECGVNLRWEIKRIGER